MGAIDPASAKQAAALAATKWSILVLDELKSGKRRYGELKRAVPLVSARMLTYTLRRLETDGLIVRRVHAEVPPRTEYRLTPLGKSLLGPLRKLCRWVEDNAKELRAARQRPAGSRAKR